MGYKWAVTTFPGSDGRQRIYAFTSSNNSGNLLAHNWDGSAWNWAVQGAPVPPGKPPVGCSSDPCVFTWSDGHTQFIRVNVVCDDGHLWANYWQGSKWQWIDQGAPPNVRLLGARPSLAVAGSGSAIRSYLFVVGNDAHLHSNYWDGSRWVWADQGNPPSTVVQSTAGAVAYLDAGGVQHILVFVRGSDDQSLWCNVWNGSAWAWVNHSSPAGRHLVGTDTVTLPFSGAPNRIYSFSGTSSESTMGPDSVCANQLWIRYWDGNEWSWQDHQMAPGYSCLSAPSALSFSSQGKNYCFAFFTADVLEKSDGPVPWKQYFALFAHYWDGNTWVWHALGRPGAGTDRLHAGDAVAFYENGAERVYLFITSHDDANSEALPKLYLCFWDGSSWSWAAHGDASAFGGL